MDPKDLSAIWAPWRVEYFKNLSSVDFLLEAAQTDDDAKFLVVARRRNTFLLMNRYPYAVGHLMAVPYRKIANSSALGDAEKLEIWELVAHAQHLLQVVVAAQGFNVGINVGSCAGAGVTDHLHVHIVPRWEGDNNFMPVLSQTRVLPEALDSLYARLLKEQGRLA